MKVVAEYKEVVVIPNAPRKIWRKLNISLTGKDIFPFEKDLSEFMKEIHANLSRVNYVQVIVEVLEDGTKRIKGF